MTHNIAAKSKNTPRRAATLERLFEAAREVFVERGLNGASVEDICSRAGFTRGAFYSNFKSKDELFITLLERENTQTIEGYKTLIEAYKNTRVPAQVRTEEEALAFASQFLMPYPHRLSAMVLELEFQLLAVRTSEHYEKVAKIYNAFLESLSTLTVELLAMAGRSFNVPSLVATATFVSVYQKSVLSTLAIGGNPNRNGEDKDSILAVNLNSESAEAELEETNKAVYEKVAAEFAQLVLALTEPIDE